MRFLNLIKKVDFSFLFCLESKTAIIIIRGGNNNDNETKHQEEKSAFSCVTKRERTQLEKRKNQMK